MKGIIFDLGHTLMHFSGDWEEVETKGGKRLLDFLQAEGLPAPEAFPRYFVERRNEEAAKSDITCVEFTATEALCEALKKFKLEQNGRTASWVPAALEAFFTPEENHWEAYPDALSVLDKLRRKGYKLGIVSNATDHPFILRCVKRLGFAEYFDPVLSSASFHSRKPHPQIFWSVANGWKIKYEEVVMVGDQLYYDIFGAHQSGMKGIWIRREKSKAYTYIPEHLKTHPQLVPDATIEELSDLPEAVESLE